MADEATRFAKDISQQAPPEDRFARDLRGFGPVGLIALFAITLTGNIAVGGLVAFPLGAVLALVWVRLSHTPWNDIGYVRPRSWIITLASGVALGIALKLLMKAVVMPLLGANPVNPTYHFLAGSSALLPRAIWAMLVAGFAEETVFRGYLFERFRKLFGPTRKTKIAAVVITSLWFGLAHYFDQGLAGAQQATIVGLVLGTIFACTGSILMPMIAHAAFDLTAVAMIYSNTEAQVAHWIFK